MAKPKGSIKTGGRKKGTPNKMTTDLKVAFDDMQLNIPERINSLLPSLKPEKQIDVLMKLLDFLYPKRKSLALENNQSIHGLLLEAMETFDPDSDECLEIGI